MVTRPPSARQVRTWKGLCRLSGPYQRLVRVNYFLARAAADQREVIQTLCNKLGRSTWQNRILLENYNELKESIEELRQGWTS